MHFWRLLTDDEHITINDLICRMEADSEYDAYSYVHMQLKLQEHFGGKIIETEINGKTNVVTFRNKAMAILHDFLVIAMLILTYKRGG